MAKILLSVFTKYDPKAQISERTETIQQESDLKLLEEDIVSPAELRDEPADLLENIEATHYFKTQDHIRNAQSV